MKRVLRGHILQGKEYLAFLYGACLGLAALEGLLMLPGSLPAGLLWLKSVLYSASCAAGWMISLFLAVSGWVWGSVGLGQCISFGGMRRHWFLTLQGAFAGAVLPGQGVVLLHAALAGCMRGTVEGNWEIFQALGTPGLWPWLLLTLTGMVLACLGGVQMNRGPVRGYAIFFGTLLLEAVALLALTVGAMLQKTEGADLATGIGIGCVPVLLLGEAALWASVRKYGVR